MEHKELLISRYGVEETIVLPSINHNSLVKLGDVVEKAVKEGPPDMESILNPLAIIAKKDKKAIFPKQHTCNKRELYGFLWHLLTKGAITWNWLCDSHNGVLCLLEEALKNAKPAKEEARILNSARKLAKVELKRFKNLSQEEELRVDYPDDSQRAQVVAINIGLARAEEES